MDWIEGGQRATTDTSDPSVEHSWQEAPWTKNANLGDAVAIVADHDQAIETIKQDDVGFDDRPHIYNRCSPRHSSGPSEDEAVFEDDGPHSSPTTSHHSDDAISELPDDSRQNSQEPSAGLSPYTPVKQSSPFRNSSSVRAMQFDTTPPFRHSSHLNSPRPNPNKATAQSRNGTPRSSRSQSTLKPKLSPKKKKEHVLVLLHATVLPVPLPYSRKSMEAVLPPHIIENYKLLRDKISDTVLLRGMLIAHPREDYELLEERLLESLELRMPRILKCGHFHLDKDDAHSDSEDEDGYNSEDDDLDICEDCGRRIRDGKHGSGRGSRRWDVKIYASNGLMRGSAWEAAWREMESIDVEIGPWLPEDIKKQLNSMREQEMLQERRAKEAALEAKRKARQEQERSVLEESQKPSPRPQSHIPRRGDSHRTDSSPRLREIYGDAYRPRDEPRRPDILRQERYSEPRAPSYQKPREEIPLRTLIRNYLYLVAQDRKNIAIAVLVFAVAFLASGVFLTNSDPSSQNNVSHAAQHMKHGTSALSSSLQEPSSNPVLSSLSSYLMPSSYGTPHPSSAASPEDQTKPTSSSTQVSSSRVEQPPASATPSSAPAAGETVLPSASDSEVPAKSADADTRLDEKEPQLDQEQAGSLDFDDDSAHLVEIMED
ncbi:MAG: hypothetical protein M1812_002103 [Candelaria pacifica]|nr:MAG: hypothetical protein M1812_002103 [Candelaria pacifica]